MYFAVVSKLKHGAYFIIIKKVRFKRSDCRGNGLSQYVINNLSTSTSTVTHKRHEMNRIGSA